MAKKVIIDFEIKYKEAVKNLDEMQKEYSKLEKEVSKTSESQQELGGILDKTTGGAVTKFKNLKGTLGTVIKSFKSLKVAIMATGIGLLVVAVGSLTAMFSRSEEGQNKFAKILTQLGVIAGNVMDIFSDLGKVVFNVFTGNFKAAGEALNDVTEGIKNFGDETRREIEIAGELADKRAKADKLERQLLIDRAEATRKFNELRERAADKENVSVDERIRLLKEAGAIEEEITLKEIEAARLRFEAKKEQNALSESTKEDLDEQAQLEARLIELEASRLKKQKTLTAEITTNLREAAAERKAEQAEKDAEVKADADRELARLGAIQKIRDDFTKQLEDRDAEKEFEKLELAKSRKLAELEELDATEAQKADIILFYDNLIASAKRRDEEAEKKRTEILEKQKIATVANTMGAIANLLGKNSKAGKALAIGQALINTYLGITEVLSTKSTLPEPFATISRIGNIATVLATGMQSVKSIQSTNPQSPSGAASISPRGNGGEASPQAPAFNVVGASVTNQLAEAIGEQTQQPVQAFVVSNDVSTAQDLDRNIIQGATIG